MHEATRSDALPSDVEVAQNQKKARAVRFKNLAADIARYRKGGESLVGVLCHPAVWAIIWYRFGRWIYHGTCPGLVRLPLKVIFLIVYKFMEAFMQMRLDPSATIGEGLMLGHSGGIHINPEAIIGKNCDIAHHVTLGTSAMGRAGAPVLGDGVYIGTGATIVGRVKIGDGAKIAANTLVITNVPAGATVMGVPGKIVMRAPQPEAGKV